MKKIMKKIENPEALEIISVSDDDGQLYEGYDANEILKIFN